MLLLACVLNVLAEVANFTTNGSSDFELKRAEKGRGLGQALALFANPDQANVIP